MDRMVLKKLLEIERELAVGDEKGMAPKTLERIRKLTEIMAIIINREEEKKIISDWVLKECGK